MVTAVRQPSPYVIVRIVPHFVALGQQRVLTVQLQMSDYRGVAIGVLPVGHINLSSDSLWLPGDSNSSLSNGCSWYTIIRGRGYFFYGGKCRAAPVGFGSGDEVSAVVDRHTNSRSENGVLWFLCNGKALVEVEPLPIGFAKDAVLVISFRYSGSAKIVSFE